MSYKALSCIIWSLILMHDKLRIINPIYRWKKLKLTEFPCLTQCKPKGGRGSSWGWVFWCSMQRHALLWHHKASNSAFTPHMGYDDSSQLTEWCSDFLDALLLLAAIGVGGVRRTLILLLVVISPTAIYGSSMSLTSGRTLDTSCQHWIYDSPNYCHPIC